MTFKLGDHVVLSEYGRARFVEANGLAPHAAVGTILHVAAATDLARPYYVSWKDLVPGLPVSVLYPYREEELVRAL